MSDESFFREVSEELRQDRLKSIWTRFGTAIIAVIVVIILVTVGYVGWDRYSIAQANASGDRYLAAQDLVGDGDIDGAIEAFRAIAEDGWGSYPDLARMSIANAEAEAGRNQDAIASYGEVASDSSVPESMREMADLRAAYLLIDHGSLADVRARAERLTGDDNPLRYAARDAIGLAAWKAGETETARDLYQSIVESGDAPSGITQRAGLIIGLLTANEPYEAGSAQAEETADMSAGEPASTSDQAADEQQPAPEASGQEMSPETDADTEAGTAATPENTSAASPDATLSEDAADGAETAPSETTESAPAPEAASSAEEITPAPADAETSSTQAEEPAATDDTSPQNENSASEPAANETGAAQLSDSGGEAEAEPVDDPETVILPEPEADQDAEPNQ
ncbi:tetratricopeptide repeat protein [Fulvimarina sp. MAC8]|uniref:tetratricopeptide repeat protein n=1 Tax=Fulvimarina sp. MAC8 TaxID=3162874 RepID=UPI0032EC0B09